MSFYAISLFQTDAKERKKEQKLRICDCELIEINLVDVETETAALAHFRYDALHVTGLPFERCACNGLAGHELHVPAHRAVMLNAVLDFL